MHLSWRSAAFLITSINTRAWDGKWLQASIGYTSMKKLEINWAGSRDMISISSLTA
jgi:hypothetical protein